MCKHHLPIPFIFTKAPLHISSQGLFLSRTGHRTQKPGHWSPFHGMKLLAALSNLLFLTLSGMCRITHAVTALPIVYSGFPLTEFYHDKRITETFLRMASLCGKTWVEKYLQLYSNMYRCIGIYSTFQYAIRIILMSMNIFYDFWVKDPRLTDLIRLNLL